MMMRVLLTVFLVSGFGISAAQAADKRARYKASDNPIAVSDWQLLSLQAASEHNGSDVWSGKFTGLNGRNYNAQSFYTPTNQPFSAKAVFARTGNSALTWVLPLGLDAGYQARLYQAEPLLTLGGGAALRLGRHSMLSLRLDNIVRLGGKIAEQACYDVYRRQFHCGTGLAWTDYKNSNFDRRGSMATAHIKLRFTHRFSF